MLNNLPAAKANAVVVADLYRDRWLLETAFLHLTKSLNCEINTLGYPKAALFGFCMALAAYNMLAVTRAAMRATWGAEAGDENISTYYLADEIAGIHRGMMIGPAATGMGALSNHVRATIGRRITRAGRKGNTTILQETSAWSQEAETEKNKRS